MGGYVAPQHEFVNQIVADARFRRYFGRLTRCTDVAPQHPIEPFSG